MSDTQPYWASARRRFSGEWALLALGGVYWVLRERDERPLEHTSGGHTSLATEEGKSHHEP